MPHLLHRLKFPENAPLFWLGSPKIPSFPLMNDPERHETTGNYDDNHRNVLKRRGKDVCKGMGLTPVLVIQIVVWPSFFLILSPGSGWGFAHELAELG